MKHTSTITRTQLSPATAESILLKDGQIGVASSVIDLVDQGFDLVKKLVPEDEETDE